MLELSQKTAKIKIFAEPVIIMLSAINVDSDMANSFLNNTLSVLLAKVAEKFENLKQLDFQEPIQNLQQVAWLERFFNYSIQIKRSMPNNDGLVYSLKSNEPMYFSATFTILLPSLGFNDKFSIGLMREIQPNGVITTEELATDWLDLFWRLLKNELKSELANLDVHISGLKAYVPATEMRGTYLKTLLTMYNTHTALSLIKENI